MFSHCIIDIVWAMFFEINKAFREVFWMRKENPVRYSSAVGETWVHCEFKVKYCHPIFDDEIYREGMRTLLLEAAYEYSIPIGEMGFDNNHVHFLADMCLYDKYTLPKLLRGYTAKKFFEYFPELKLSKEQGGKFWDSGLWNPSYYIGSPKNFSNTINYIRNQKYGRNKCLKQMTLSSWA